MVSRICSISLCVVANSVGVCDFLYGEVMGVIGSDWGSVCCPTHA